MSRSPHNIAKGIALATLLALGGLTAAGVYFYLQNVTADVSRKQEKSYRYDDSAIRKVDPELIKYKQVGRIDTGMSVPTALAVDGNERVIVGGDQIVKVFAGSDLAVQMRVPAQPTCVACRDGEILVGLRDHVEVYDTDGRPKASWPALGANAWLTSIACADSDVWIGDFGNRRVVRCDSAGKVQFELVKAGATSTEGLLLPSPHLDVAIGKSGEIWLANTGRSRLEAYGREGKLLRTLGRPGAMIEGFVGCCNPSDFALLPDGKIVTSEKGAARVKVFTRSGGLDGVVADSSILGEIEGAMDLAVDRKGRILVLDSLAKCVRIFERNNE